MRNSQCAGNGFGAPAKGAGLRPIEIIAPTSQDRIALQVGAILLGGIALIGIVGTTFLNLLAAM